MTAEKWVASPSPCSRLSRWAIRCGPQQTYGRLALGGHPGRLGLPTTVGALSPSSPPKEPPLLIAVETQHRFVQYRKPLAAVGVSAKPRCRAVAGGDGYREGICREIGVHGQLFRRTLSSCNPPVWGAAVDPRVPVGSRKDAGPATTSRRCVCFAQVRGTLLRAACASDRVLWRESLKFTTAAQSP